MFCAVRLVTGGMPAVRRITSSCVYSAGKTWRERQGLARSGNEYGPLTDRPDWSYADGRPAPPGQGQLERKAEQRQLAERIDVLSKEMINAKKTYKAKLEAERREEEQKMMRRLKPKGSSWRRKDQQSNHR
ncbi:large ribosomal subunit protein mL52-like [Diadema setosum]|uniref:large ribosomal subunit protein mL52-like n=1 Tax=Diadema setosum TaxID=31175 RepID=UPI003B3B4C9B